MDNVPLLFWYDKPHICNTQHYRKVINNKHFNYNQNKYIGVKFLVEATFGHIIYHDIKMNGIDEHEKYGTYLYYNDPGKIIVEHLNGRSYITQEKKDEIRARNIEQTIDL